MTDQNQDSSQVVTIKEAIEKVKKWSAEKDYEKVQQGCTEILEVEPENAEIKDLFEKAKAELGAEGDESKSVVEPTPEAAPAEPVAEPEAPAEPPPAAPEATAAPATVPLAEEKPAPAVEEPSAEGDTPEPTPEMATPVAEPKPEAKAAPAEPVAEPADIFNKGNAAKTETPEVATPAEPVKDAEPTATEAPKAKKGGMGKIIALIVFVVIVAGGVFAYTQGMLDPVIEQIMRLFG